MILVSEGKPDVEINAAKLAADGTVIITYILNKETKKITNYAPDVPINSIYDFRGQNYQIKK